MSNSNIDKEIDTMILSSPDSCRGGYFRHEEGNAAEQFRKQIAAERRAGALIADGKIYKIKIDGEIYTPDEARELFTTFVNDYAKKDYFKVLYLLTRNSANRARGDAEIRDCLSEKLDICVKCYPEIKKSAEIFRAVYLEGNSRPKYKEIGIRYFMDKRTVCRHIEKVLRILVVAVFGIEAIEFERIN